ncbi:hypothetical protein QVN30_10755 [Collinsella ihumii]|uniref:Uncharacterized protein n=1 Tax=Collinsella ihumii TaxID=1720204 RepID=A0ABT7XH89_9ACTN|nr:hypothetical protein [Collinsella ihumii]
MVAQALLGHGICTRRSDAFHKAACEGDRSSVFSNLKGGTGADACDRPGLLQKLPGFDFESLGKAIERFERDVLITLLDGDQDRPADANHQGEASLRQLCALPSRPHVPTEFYLKLFAHGFDCAYL